MGKQQATNQIEKHLSGIKIRKIQIRVTHAKTNIETIQLTEESFLLPF